MSFCLIFQPGWRSIISNPISCALFLVGGGVDAAWGGWGKLDRVFLSQKLAPCRRALVIHLNVDKWICFICVFRISTFWSKCVCVTAQMLLLSTIRLVYTLVTQHFLQQKAYFKLKSPFFSVLFEVCAFVCSHISACHPYQRLRSRHPYLKLPTPQILESATEVIKHTHTHTDGHTHRPVGDGKNTHTVSLAPSTQR